MPFTFLVKKKEERYQEDNQNPCQLITDNTMANQKLCQLKTDNTRANKNFID